MGERFGSTFGKMGNADSESTLIRCVFYRHRPVQWHDDGTVRPGHLVQLDPIQFDPGKFDDLLERKKIARRMRYLKRKKAS